MKQLFLSMAVLLLTAHLAFSQQAPLQDFIDKYKHDHAFSYAFLSKDLFEVAIQSDIDNKDWKKLHNVIRNIGALTVLAADSVPSGMELYKEAMRAVPISDFDELLAVHDGKDRVKIWAKDEGNMVTDLVLLVGTSDAFVLVCFSGNLELDNLSALADLFDAESAENLAKTSQAIAADFSISPNPNNGNFTLQFTSVSDQPVQLSVLDQNGRQMSVLNLSVESSQAISLPGLPAGLYWVQLKTQQGKVGVKQVQIVK